MKQQLYICTCQSPEHQMIWSPSPYDGERIIYVQINLHKKPFWQRLKHGIKYILGHQSIYGAFDEIVLGPEHSKQLLDASRYLNPEEFEEVVEKRIKLDLGIY